MPVASVGGINLYYEIKGRGDPLLLIMGYGFSSSHWFVIRDRLSEEYRVILFDNRGTGRSDKPDMPYTAKMMAGDVVGLIDVLGIGAANVFGISMGGMIAQEFALSYPKYLKNLILGCTSCGGPKAVQISPDAVALWRDPDWANQSEEEKALGTVPWLCNQDFIDNNPAVFKRFIAIFTEYPTPQHSLVSQMNVLMTFDSYDRLPQITAPTLVICGARDRLMPSENSKILASGIPGAELSIIENAEHAFIIDSADESARIILQFLKKHSKHG